MFSQEVKQRVQKPIVVYEISLIDLCIVVAGYLQEKDFRSC